ncbi:TrmH family RNA methyltransferase [Pararhizobium mangrovi]|uniref:TrmH family RNA methyltransferase n=1 Tax=Pararhizobium mangrovi TaxID=2590452 RepID=UPI001F1C67B3|nr:RNA methyltransferase [Pararhizobium mangrovi]
MTPPASLANRVIRIDDPADPRIAGFRDIRERDLRRRHGSFIVEGAVVLPVLLDAHEGGRFCAESVLILENRLEGFAERLERLPADVPIHVAPRAVIDAVAGFPMHRGVLALARESEAASAPLDFHAMAGNALVVAGQAIANHDNMGGILRNAAVFGADGALFDAQSCDPLYRKAIRVSVGGVLRVPFEHGGTGLSMVERLAANGFTVIGLSPRGEHDLETVPIEGRTALLLGTEGPGLTEGMLSRVTSARISQAPGMDSLNVATASGIALYTLARRMGRIA